MGQISPKVTFYGEVPRGGQHPHLSKGHRLWGNPPSITGEIITQWEMKGHLLWGARGDCGKNMEGIWQRSPFMGKNAARSPVEWAYGRQKG